MYPIDEMKEKRGQKGRKKGRLACGLYFISLLGENFRFIFRSNTATLQLYSNLVGYLFSILIPFVCLVQHIMKLTLVEDSVMSFGYVQTEAKVQRENYQKTYF